MTNPYDDKEPRWVDLAISRLLRIGVLLSIAVIAIGMIVTFVHHPSYFSSRPALGSLTSTSMHYPRNLIGVLRGTIEGRGQAIISLGVLLLIATPVARVALSIVVFAIERDRLYVAITAAVLTLLLIAFALGSVE